MEAVFILGAIAVFVLIIRLFGAWMLRINEIIALQKQIIKEIKKISLNS